LPPPPQRDDQSPGQTKRPRSEMLEGLKGERVV